MDFPQLLHHRIRARFPLIWLETYEFDRIYRILKKIAFDSDTLLFRWTPVEGLGELGLTMDTFLPVGETITDPRQVLTEIVRRSDEFDSEIFVLEGMGDYIGDSEVKALARKICTELRRSRKPMTVICLSPEAALPMELLRLVDVLTVPDADLEDFRGLLMREVAGLNQEISDELSNQLLELTSGMTLFEAELIFALVSEETQFGEGALDVMVRERGLLLEKASLVDSLEKTSQ